VTGGAVRIGRAITEALIAAGVDVIVHYKNSGDNAGTLSQTTIQADLNDPAQCETLIARAAEKFGTIDILINNAAVFYKTGLMESTYEKLLNELQPNLFAPLALMRGFARQMTAGKIINMLDRRITSHDTLCVPYMLGKKGLEELTKLAALEFAPEITVNAVAPGAVLPPPEQANDIAWEPAGKIPLEKRPTPADIAGAVIYLLKTDVITGQILYVDGGQNLLH